MKNIKQKIILSHISIFHFIKLAWRSVLFLWAAVEYLSYRLGSGADFKTLLESKPVIFGVVWVVFFTEMLLRFFSSSLESPGCQKIFKKKYRPTGEDAGKDMHRGAFAVLVIWLVLTFAIGLLYRYGVIDLGIVILISLFFSVCDLICILFFCPFHELIMKNKCCTTCRIYNWDFAMMFSPFAFVPVLYTQSLFYIALALMAVWELTVFRHPERFSERSNAALHCENCSEKLCRHKKSLQRFLRKQKFWKNRQKTEE